MTIRVAVVLVTHDSERDLPETLASIANQTKAPDSVIAIDDASQDATPTLLATAGFSVVKATSQARDTRTRIAHNFTQGVLTAARAGSDLIALGDHDDVWHSDRLAHQVEMLQRNPSVAMVASDGYLIDDNSVAEPGTIRESFPIPDDFANWPHRKQMTYGLRHSLAAGGASAIRFSALTDWSVPSGWLHDRWWSLLALQHRALLIDPTPVIDYRLSVAQQVGLDTANQEHGAVWALGKVRDLARTGRRSRDVIRLVR